MTAVPVSAAPYPKTRPLWLALLAVIVIGGLALGLRLATYDRWLPFIDYTDEAVYVALGQEVRGLSDETALRETYGALPPLYTWFNAAVQTGYDAVKPHDYALINEYYTVLRLLAVGMGVLTALAMTWLGWQIAGPVAGWAAGLIWAAHPTIVDLNSLAIPDPPLYLTMAAALVGGVWAIKRGSRLALLGALIAGIIGTYLKYWVVTVTFPFLAAWLILVRRDGRGMVGWTLIYALIGGTAAVYLIMGINPLASTNKLTEFSGGSLLERALDGQRLTNNFWHAAYPVGVPLFVGGLMIGAAAWLYSRARGRWHADGRLVALLVMMAVAGLFLTTAISNIDLSAAGRMRHILPTMIVMVVLWGLALAQITRAAADELAARDWTAARARAAALTPALLIAAVLAFPYAAGNGALIERYGTSHVVNQVRDWADVAVPNDGLVMQPFQSDLDRVWNRVWGAYAGNNPLLYWSETQAALVAADPQTYVGRNIDYLVIGEYDLTRGQYTDPAVREWLNGLYLLKTFPAGAGVAGTTTYFYRMQPPQIQANVDFGGIIRLEGYDLSGAALRAGETITFRPYWRPLNAPPANYSMFVHLYPADALDLRAQQDGPLSNGPRQTAQWTDTGEVFLGRTTALTIPPDVPAGRYRLAIGVYDYTTFARLPLADGTDFYTVPIVIE